MRPREAFRTTRLMPAAALTLLWTCVPPARGQSVPPVYDVRFLGPATLITDMNDSGEIVGWSSPGGVQAFVAGPDHPWELLPLPDGYVSGWAQGINDAGVVVGSVCTCTLPEFGQAVAWIPDGQGGWDIEFLGQLPGHTQSVAYSVTNDGRIIGVSIVPGFQGGPTVWFNSPDGIMNLSALGAPSGPKDLNEEGVIVGINGELFDLDDLQPIPLPPVSGSMTGFQGWGINNHGHLAGTAFYGGFVSRSAVRWTEAGWEALGAIVDASGLVTAYDIKTTA